MLHQKNVCVNLTCLRALQLLQTVKLSAFVQYQHGYHPFPPSCLKVVFTIPRVLVYIKHKSSWRFVLPQESLSSLKKRNWDVAYKRRKLCQWFHLLTQAWKDTPGKILSWKLCCTFPVHKVNGWTAQFETIDPYQHKFCDRSLSTKRQLKLFMFSIFFLIFVKSGSVCILCERFLICSLQWKLKMVQWKIFGFHPLFISKYKPLL